MKDNFNDTHNCSQDEVLLFRDKAFKISTIQSSFKKVFCEKLAPLLYESLIENNVKIDPGEVKNYQGRDRWITSTAYENFFTKGIVCEILKLNAKKWQKGKFRIKVSLEFYPDEPAIR